MSDPTTRRPPSLSGLRAYAGDAAARAGAGRSWQKNALPVGKVLLHGLLLLPLVRLLLLYHSGALALEPDPVETITHATGNWALWILLASLAITPLRRLNPRLASLVRFRRMVGLYAFFYASLHLATYVFLYSGFDLPGSLRAAAAGQPGEFARQWHEVWPTILDDLKRRHFIQAGLVSWLLLLVLAVTSPSVVLRAMGGRTWRRVHWLVYVAAIGTVVHYWWQVKPGNRSPWVDTAVLAGLLGFRLRGYVAKRLLSRSGSSGAKLAATARKGP